MTTSRREFLAALAVAPLASAQDDDRVYLIAHRGGVVDDAHPENSPSSVEAAIERGYWMLEVDVRRSRDGHAVVHHDATLQRFYGEPRAVDAMDWSDIQRLRATPGGTRPMRFDELCARCAGRIRLMLDIKGPQPDELYAGMIASLRRHDLLETTFSLSGGRLPELTDDVVAKAVDRAQLAAAVSRGAPVSRTCFLFELGSVLDADALRLCRAHDVTPVAALNTFRTRAPASITGQGPKPMRDACARSASDTSRSIPSTIAFHDVVLTYRQFARCERRTSTSSADSPPSSTAANSRPRAACVASARDDRHS